MAQTLGLQVTGIASASQAAASSNDLVRLVELLALLGAKAAASHTHTAVQVTDFLSGTQQAVNDLHDDSDTVTWSFNNGFSLAVNLKSGGGIESDAQGLFINSGVSRPGHQHAQSDISGFLAALFDALRDGLADTNSLEWVVGEEFISGTVRRSPTGGIVETGDGLALDFGSGTNQVTRGDHTHAGLHNPVSFAASSTLTLALDNQVITIEVRRKTAGGLLADADGLYVDLGSGTNQAARGTHTHAQLHNAATAVNTPTLTLGITAGQVVSGTVRTDPAPGANRGKLAVGAAGLQVMLGTAADEAAAGNHSHAAATTGADGLMAAADKLALDELVAAAETETARGKEGLVVTIEGYGAVIPAGYQTALVMPYSGTITGWDLVADHPSGTLFCDLWRDTWGNFPPTLADSFTGAFSPFLSGTRHNRNHDVAWSFGPNDVIFITVLSASYKKKASLCLRVDRL